LSRREYRAVKRLLKNRYPANNELAPTNDVILGVRFHRDRTCFERTKIPELSNLRAKVAVYSAWLDTNYHEFPRVPVAIVTEETMGIYEVHECFSPLFTDPNPSFFSLLLGSEVPEQADRESLAVGIAKILKEITPEGKLKNGRYGDDDIYRIELWSGSLQFRDLAFHYTPPGKLLELNITNSKTSKMVLGISRN